MHFVVGHAQTGERLADLIGSQRAAAIPVKVCKRRRKILLLQREHMLLVVVGVGVWLKTASCLTALIKYMHNGSFRWDTAMWRTLAQSIAQSRARLNTA